MANSGAEQSQVRRNVAQTNLHANQDADDLNHRPGPRSSDSSGKGADQRQRHQTERVAGKRGEAVGDQSPRPEAMMPINAETKAINGRMVLAPCRWCRARTGTVPPRRIPFPCRPSPAGRRSAR